MTYYRCDLKECGKEFISDLQIQLKGYHPSKSGGILIPEQHHHYEFCSRQCFIKWMIWALEHEVILNQ